MKSHWKLVTVLVIGVLIGSQIGPIHQAFAVAGTAAQMDNAMQQYRLALQNVKGDLRDVDVSIGNLKSMPMIPAEEEMVKAINSLAAAQQSMVVANEQAMTLMQLIAGRNK